MVKVEDIRKKGINKDVIMSIRTTKDVSKWMKEQEISPTLLFNKAVEELMDEVRSEGGK